MTVSDFDLAGFISRGILSGGKWNDLLREILPYAENDKSFFAELHTAILRHFEGLKEETVREPVKEVSYRRRLIVGSMRNKVLLKPVRLIEEPVIMPEQLKALKPLRLRTKEIPARTPDQLRKYHETLLQKSENGINPFGENHPLANITPKALEGLRKEWRETAEKPAEEIKVPLRWILSPKDLRERIGFARILTGVQLSVKDIERLESEFKAACETVMRANGIEYGAGEHSAPGNNETEAGKGQIDFGLTENQLGALYDGLVNIQALDSQTQKVDFVNIHLGESATGRIHWKMISARRKEPSAALLLRLYKSLGVDILDDKDRIRKIFKGFIKNVYENKFSNLKSSYSQLSDSPDDRHNTINGLVNKVRESQTSAIG